MGTGTARFGCVQRVTKQDVHREVEAMRRRLQEIQEARQAVATRLNAVGVRAGFLDPDLVCDLADIGIIEMHLPPALVRDLARIGKANWREATWVVAARYSKAK